MRILHAVSEYYPSVGGAQDVVRRVSEHLANNGHEVVVATSRHPERKAHRINGVEIVDFACSGNLVDGLRGEIDAYRRFLEESSFHLVLFYAAQQWSFDAAIPVLGKIQAKKIFAPCGFSMLYHPQYAEYFAMLPAVIGQCDHVLLHSASYRDAAFLQTIGEERWTVIPNGADEGEFDTQETSFRARYGIPPDRPMLLHVGSHTGMKGHGLAMRAFMEARIGPATLVLIGNSLHGTGCLVRCRRLATYVRCATLNRKRVLLFDPPREDVVAAFHDADLFLFTSSVECSPIVLFEAMASRTPVVTLDCGNAREILSWGSNGLCVESRFDALGFASADARVIAAAIEELIENPERRITLANNGRDAWKSDFTWHRICGMYEDLYRTLVAPDRQPPLRHTFVPQHAFFESHASAP